MFHTSETNVNMKLTQHFKVLVPPLSSRKTHRPLSLQAIVHCRPSNQSAVKSDPLSGSLANHTHAGNTVLNNVLHKTQRKIIVMVKTTGSIQAVRYNMLPVVYYLLTDDELYVFKAVDEHSVPGVDLVYSLAEYLVEIRTETFMTLSNRRSAIFFRFHSLLKKPVSCRNIDYLFSVTLLNVCF